MKIKIYSALAVFVLLSMTWNCGDSQTDNPVSVSKPQYDKTSIVFSLNLLSNINYGRWGSPSALQQAATTAMNNVLQDSTVNNLIGTWTPVWGPVTYTNDSTSHPDTCISDNTMVLLKGNNPGNPAETMYVLSIAGTVTASAFDWVGENLVLDSMEQWPAPVQGQSNTGTFASPQLTSNSDTVGSGKYISQGIGTGLNILFNIMQDGSKGTLMNYLKTVVGADTSSFELAVAGHSLGGALSPCVALSLIDNQSYWNPGGNSLVTCYATAGFTPGNKLFADYFNQKLDTNFHGGCNNYDVAIHMYEDSTMNLAANLYAGQNQHLTNECVFSKLFSCIQSQLSPLNYTSLYSPSDTFNQIMTANFDSIYIADSAAYYSLNTTNKGDFDAMAGPLKMNCIPHFGEDSIPYAQLYGRTMCFAGMTLLEHFNAYITHYQIGSFAAIYNGQLSKNPVPAVLDSEEISDITSFPLIKTCVYPKL